MKISNIILAGCLSLEALVGCAVPVRNEKVPVVQEEKKQTTSVAQDVQQPRLHTPQVQEEADRFVVRNVPYRNSFYRVEWSKELLENGSAYAQDEWLDLVVKTDWKIPDISLVYATLDALYSAKETNEQNLPSENLRKLFAQDVCTGVMVTSSRVLYDNQGFDTIVHSYCYRNKKEVNTHISGEHIKDAESCAELSEALFGTKDYDYVAQVFQWTAGKKFFLKFPQKKVSGGFDVPIVLGLRDTDKGQVLILSLDSYHSGGVRGVRYEFERKEQE